MQQPMRHCINEQGDFKALEADRKALAEERAQQQTIVDKYTSEQAGLDAQIDSIFEERQRVKGLQAGTQLICPHCLPVLGSSVTSCKPQPAGRAECQDQLNADERTLCWLCMRQRLCILRVLP